MRGIGIAILAAIVIIGVVTRPVCQPLDEETVRVMDPPIYRRTDRTLWFKTYQVRGQRWCECRPWIERALFF